MRTSGRPARGLGDARVLGAVLEQAAQRSRLLADLREEPGAGRSGTASGCDTGLASDEHALDLEFLAEDDEVGGGADLDPAGVGADHARGDGGGRVERVLERDAERVQVAHRLDHRQDAAREHAVVRRADDSVAHLDRDVAEPVGAVAADAGAGDGVGDEREAAARRPARRAAPCRGRGGRRRG